MQFDTYRGAKASMQLNELHTVNINTKGPKPTNAVMTPSGKKALIAGRNEKRWSHPDRQFGGVVELWTYPYCEWDVSHKLLEVNTCSVLGGAVWEGYRILAEEGVSVGARYTLTPSGFLLQPPTLFLEWGWNVISQLSALADMLPQMLPSLFLHDGL